MTHADARRRKYEEEKRCQTVEELTELAKSRGYFYAEAWAKKQIEFRHKKP